MPRNNTDVSTEYVDCFTLRVFHSLEPMRFEIEVPELNCRFAATTLADATANAAQGLLYYLHEKQRRVEMLQPGQPH